MKHYYFADKDQQFGPFTIEELKSKRLKKSTLVWTDGMPDWDIAGKIVELKDILVSEPPPLPKKETIQPENETVRIRTTPTPTPVVSSKYDLSYEKEDGATIIGVLLGLFSIFIYLFGPSDIFETEEAASIAIIILFILRICIAVWVGNIASRQNRSSTGWGLFALLFPTIALIIIGLLKKLKLKIVLDGSLPKNQQVAILFEKAQNLFSHNRKLECIEVLNKAIEIENNNFNCIELRGIANYETKNYEKSKLDFETLIRNEQFLPIAYFYMGNIAIIEKNRELAVSYWLKANELNYKDAKKKLDLFDTFTGNYLLEKSQLRKKLKMSSPIYTLYYYSGKYQGGLPQIDQIEKTGSLGYEMSTYDNGIHIKLKGVFRTYHIGIAYYEIDNIVYKEMDDKFELHLSDKNILTFSINKVKPKGLCELFEQATGKTPDAALS